MTNTVSDQVGFRLIRSSRQFQKSGSILVIYLFKDAVGQADSIDSPSALRWNRCWGVVEVFVFCFKESIVDFVEFIAEDLLWRVRSVFESIGCTKNPILQTLKRIASDAC